MLFFHKKDTSREYAQYVQNKWNLEKLIIFTFEKVNLKFSTFLYLFYEALEFVWLNSLISGTFKF